MSVLWEKGDWRINRADEYGGGLCLRHIGCGQLDPEGLYDGIGSCACSDGVCWNCKVEVPDDIRGFFALVEWKR